MGLPLAKLCAAIAMFQVQAGRHYVVEQPRGSDMFQLPEWQALVDVSYKCQFDQCQLGLKEKCPPYLPLLKPTEMWSSHPTITQHLAGLHCNKQHESHGKVNSEAQVWPIQLCNKLAVGIAELMISSQTKKQYFPTYDCPGCRGHARKDDKRHTRDSTCKWKDVEPMEWGCEACQRHRPRSHTSHTFGPDCQWAIAATREAGGRRPRKGHHPRDPSVPASREPTGTLRLDGSANIDVVSPEEVSAVPNSVDAVVPSAEETAEIAPSSATSPEVLTPEEAEARRKRKSESMPTKRKVDASTQAEQQKVRALVPVRASEADQEEPPWTKHDLGAVLQQLRSIRPGIVRRALRRLHIRWFHCSAKRMKMLLTAAGVSPEVIELVEEIVSTCSICRMWARPGPRAVASTSISTRFNETVQYDLLFIKRHTVLHMLDTCIRWSAAMIIDSKETDELLNGMDKLWFQQFGSPQELVGDRESGIAVPESSASFLERRGIKLTLKARSQHAFMIERHNEILRQQVHRCDEQATSDGLRVSFANVLSESVFAKNSLFVCGGFTPYEALYGRTPQILNIADIEHEGGMEGDSFRLRQIAINSMIEATALAKAQRAEVSKTRMAGELLDLKPGDQVEFHRPPSTKDQSGWHGPATVADTTAITQGIIAVRWQGRTLDCRVQDVRRAIVFFEFLATQSQDSPVIILRMAVENSNGYCVRLGWIQQKNHWQACEANKTYSKVLLAGFYVASVCLSLAGTASFRFGRGLRTVSAVQCDDSFIFWWKSTEIDLWHHAFIPATSHLNFPRLTGLAEQDTCFVQFFMHDSEAIAQLRAEVTGVPNLGGVFEPNMPKLRDVSETANTNRQANKLKAIQDSIAENLHQDDSATPDIGADEPQLVAFNLKEGLHSIIGQGELEVGFSQLPLVEPTADRIFNEVFVVSDDQSDEPAELVFTHVTAKYLNIRNSISPGSEIVFKYHSTDEVPEVVIQRVNNILTREEALERTDECRTAMIKELQRWSKHKAWRRRSLKGSENLLQSRWVLKWKEMKHVRGIKARLVVQGFLDKQSVSNYSGTTSRWGQRLIIILSVQINWSLLSLDVSEAFLRGITFQELHEEDPSKPMRSVQLKIPPGSVELFRALEGMEDFNEHEEALEMLKPGFGLKHAPRLWNLALKRVLREIGVQPIQTDQQLFVKHDCNKKLVLAISVHVDDLKVTGLPDEIVQARKILENHF